MLGLIGFVVVVAIIVFWVVGMYNGLVRLRLQVKNAWAQIDVQLKRRHDLIPNLVETVKGYAGHEKQTLENVEAVLTAAGCSRRDVVKATVFLADIANYAAMNQVYRTFFRRPYPARSCVEAKLADPAILVEIEAIACR